MPTGSTIFKVHMSQFAEEMTEELRAAGFDELDEQQLSTLVTIIGSIAMAAVHDSEVRSMIEEHMLK